MSELENMKMKFNSQICTTREQSERLFSLGLKKETADMVHSTVVVLDNLVDLISAHPWTARQEVTNDWYPAWSLHRLIEMMPLDVVPEGGFDNCFTLIKNYPKGYSVEYDGFSYYHKENIYDTIIEGIEHLIKEGYFNKEYLEE